METIKKKKPRQTTFIHYLLYLYDRQNTFISCFVCTDFEMSIFIAL